MQNGSIPNNAQAIIQELIQLPSWEERYKKIIAIGKNAPVMDIQYKTNDWLVKGCQAQVWLHANIHDGKVIFQSDSDALITKGLITLLVKYYSGLSPQKILQDKRPSFFNTLQLQHHLTPTRVGGLFSMIRQIQYYAQGFQLIAQTKQNTYKKNNRENK